MFVTELATADDRVRLVRPDIERDAPLSLQWLAGEDGRETLRLMGVPKGENRASTIEAERERVSGFLSDNGELNWMIQLDGRVVGAIWVHLKPTIYISAPAISLMIGDKAARGHGVGRSALAAVLNWLQHSQKATVIHARHLVTNMASQRLLAVAGFVAAGKPYYDDDGLCWHNVQRVYRSSND